MSCECVCLSVYLRACLQNCVSDLRQIFCACYLWPWLNHLLVTLRYVMHLRLTGFVNDVIFHIMDRMQSPCRYCCSEWHHCIVVSRLTSLLRHISCIMSALLSAFNQLGVSVCMKLFLFKEYSISQRDARLNWSSWLVTYQNGIAARRRSPIHVLSGPVVR